MGSVKDLLLKLFGGYKGIVVTQISLYNKGKRVAPEVSENDLLNELIISRIQTRLRVAGREAEYIHYRPLLENPRKTLEEVIWALVEYEYGVWGKGLNEAEAKTYIKESIKKKVKRPEGGEAVF